MNEILKIRHYLIMNTQLSKDKNCYIIELFMVLHRLIPR